MLIIYRMCSIPSTNESPIYQDNKYKLNELCLTSFVEAFKEVKPKMIFINDFCGGEYWNMIERVVPFEYDIHPTELGINGTALYQYELASKASIELNEVILFQECDYIWLPQTGKLFEEAVKRFNLVSPYDHLNFYRDRTIHSNQVKLELFNNHHFRTTERNTMTFGMRYQTFLKNYEILKKYGYLDNEVWHDLRKAGYPLWVPLPSLATHMVKDFLAPGIQWGKYWQ